MLEWIAEKKRCAQCGLGVCGCAVLGAITFSLWGLVPDSEGHKVRMPTSISTVSGTVGGGGTFALTHISGVVTDRVMVDTTSDREYRLQPLTLYELLAQPGHRLTTVNFTFEPPVTPPPKV